MIQHEAKSSIRFRHWLMANPQETCTFEMKDTKGKNYLPWREIKIAQIDYGMAIEESEKGVLIRTPAISTGMPDYIYMKNEPTFIVIKFPDCFCMIPMKKIWSEMPLLQKGSLAVEKAREIAIAVIDL